MNAGKSSDSLSFGALGVYGVLLAVAAVLAAAIYFSYTESQAVADAYARQAEFKQLGADLARASDYLTDEVRKYAQFGERVHYDNYWREVRETQTRDRVVARLRALGAPAEELQLIEQAKRNSDALIATEKQAMARTQRGRFDEARRLLFGPQYDADKRIIMGPIAQFQQRLQQRTARTVVRARAAADRAFWLLSVASAAGVLGMIVAFSIYLRAALRRRRRLQRTAAILADSSGEMLAVAQEHERAIVKQSGTVHETTAAMDELDRSFHQTAERADEAAQTTQQARAAAEEGTRASTQMRLGMTELQGKVGAISESILGLSARIGQIGTITHLVSELAGQTHMLALNAAVEASRAGDYGKGFGVVADEIRKLADQSRESAERIRALVEEIEKATTTTVKATNEGMKGIQHGMRLSDDTAEAFQRVEQSVDHASESVQVISLNVREQLAAIGQVVDAMSALNAEAGETEAGIRQTKARIQELGEAAQDLNALA
jgi:methyl-accepting chemotaxis protein